MLKRLALAAALAASAVAMPGAAQELPRLRDAESPDGRHDCVLQNTEGRLRFLVVEKGDPTKVLGEVPSAYEAQLGTNDKAERFAMNTRVRWSPDARYVIFKEPDNSDAQYGVTLVKVGTESAELVPFPIERIKAASAKEHTDWIVEFRDWLGNRTFLLRLHGMTYRTGRDNEHDKMPLLVRIKKDGTLSVINADE